MNADLVLLNYNDYETTLSFVNRVININNIRHIVVVDNASTDDSFEKLKKIKDEKIDVIRTEKNGGYSYGNNYGIQYLIKKYNSHYIIVSNPDVIIDYENIQKMLDVYQKKKNVGIVTCKMKCTSSINLPIAWKIPKFLDCVIDNLLITKKLFGNRICYSEKELKKDLCEVDVLPGSLFMISTSVYLEIDGFDENTFLYFEENILAQKLKNSQKKNYLINNSEYIHNHSVSINKNIRSISTRLKINFQSKYYYCKKYLKSNFLKLLFLRVTFYIGLYEYLLYIKIKRK